MRNAPRGDGWSRRQFILRGAATFGVAGFGLGGGLFARPRFDAYPFSLGVASGDPSADGFVLWTRLAPDPLHGGGMPSWAWAKIRVRPIALLSMPSTRNTAKFAASGAVPCATP